MKSPLIPHPLLREENGVKAPALTAPCLASAGKRQELACGQSKGAFLAPEQVLPKDAACGSCCHFQNEPSFLEAEIAGLSALASAYASVRSDDGICGLHDTLTSAKFCCPQYDTNGATPG